MSENTRNGSPKKLLTMAAAVVAVTPLMLASPSSADADVATSRIAFLRGLVEARAEVATQNPILRDAVVAARADADNPTLLAEVVGHTNGHSNVHSNGHTNQIEQTEIS
jgi:hypothetical protein